MTRMKRHKEFADEFEELVGEVITGSKLFKLKMPIVMSGVERMKGEKVELNDRQAESLKRSGHI